MERRALVFELLQEHGNEHGTQALIARDLGVSESTISRDIRAILAMAYCPTCHRPYPRPYPYRPV